jgi:hypothetical protein
VASAPPKRVRKAAKAAAASSGGTGPDQDGVPDDDALLPGGPAVGPADEAAASVPEV